MEDRYIVEIKTKSGVKKEFTILVTLRDEAYQNLIDTWIKAPNRFILVFSI